jgi:hypothetical protein
MAAGGAGLRRSHHRSIRGVFSGLLGIHFSGQPLHGMQGGRDGILIRTVAIGNLRNQLLVNFAQGRIMGSVGFMALGLGRRGG